MRKFNKILILVFLCTFFPKLVYANIATTVGMSDFTEHYYKINAENNNGEGFKSSTVTTAPKGIVPGNVTGLSVSNTSVTQVDLTFL
ncbi:MAG: hypothetical protein ACYDEJ_07995 [Desulfitobacteriaceae bacterium]